MKKFLLITLTTCILNASAQYTITSVHNPAIGDQDYVLVDTLPGMGVESVVGHKGNSQVYNLSAFEFDYHTVTSWDEPINPDVSISNVYNEESEMGGLHFNAQSDVFELVAIDNISRQNFNIDRPVIMHDPLVISSYPSSYGMYHTDIAEGESEAFYVGFQIGGGTTIDSSQVFAEMEIESEFDGSGTLITPFNVYENVLRERVKQITEVKIMSCMRFGGAQNCTWIDAGQFNPQFAEKPDTTVSYYWYNSSSKFPLAIVELNADESKVLSIVLNDNDLQSINEQRISADDWVYPNPANDVLYFKNPQVTRAHLVDMTGRLVLSVNVVGGEINLSQIEKGTYVLSFFGEGIIQRKTIIVE